MTGSELTVLTAQKQPSGVYRVAHNGRILGDSRGYSTLAACEMAIDNEIAIDIRDARRFERPLMYVKG